MFEKQFQLPNELISIPRRGLRHALPESVDTKVRDFRVGSFLHRDVYRRVRPQWSSDDLVRFDLILNSSVLAQRFPHPDAGRKLMGVVDYNYRNELFGYSLDMSKIIQNAIYTMPSYFDKYYAILLFGSIPRGLVKRPGYFDPSNIDIAVIGNFNSSERDYIFDHIRQDRHDLQDYMLRQNKMWRMPFEQRCNVGVHIQDQGKITGNSFSTALQYISSCAYPLYDNYHVWSEIESDAIAYYNKKFEKKRERKLNNRRLR
jgi:hypothetical protein